MRIGNGLRLLAGLAVGLASVLSAAENARLSVINAMILRPEDPWPRGKGHVVLGLPGSLEDFKAYHEPGGSFSPAYGSFGLSLWVLDDEGRRVTTSDTLPLAQIEQRWVWSQPRIWPRRVEMPAVRTETPYYTATWSAVGVNHWQLHLRAKSTNQLALMVRSVGPAAAPLRTLHWFPDNRLFVNDRWVVRFNVRPASTEVVPPAGQSPVAEGVGQVTWPAEQAWGYARFGLLRNLDCWITVEDAVIPPPNPLKIQTLRPGLTLQLPDREFVSCLEAQVAHLMISLVNNETRPGEPNNYPLNWLRDGAYVIVALARAGQLEVATDLCRPFAENDFFGGFGSEADGPGLALWALTEVAARKRDPSFDRWLWPHVRRKATLVQELLAAKEPLRKPYVGPVVPAHAQREDLDLVCDPARDGLIVGRVDWHRPLLFVNAVSYRGLVNAAELAARLARREEHEAWQSCAAGLRQAWSQAFDTSESDNERSYIGALHPTWVVAQPDPFAAKLAQRRARTHDQEDTLKERPLWTYFTVAEAHQWLALGQPERTWKDLRWFWANQASPGLFSWWEGNGEENTFGRWQEIRGWVTPPHVTPHYWTAAEMLLLQLDMLVCLDESGDLPRLIVGAGIPPSWLEQPQPLRVEGLSTRLGPVDWQWTKGRVNARLKGWKCEVKLGPGFPADTVLRVRD
jgi:hypothetical protein